MRLKNIIITFLILTGCHNNTYIEGPELIEGSIQYLSIESLKKGTKSAVINNQDSIKIVEYLFSKYGWEKNNGRKFIPSYKFIIITKDKKEITYWVGAYSDLNEFPCYKLCSGWWVTSTDNDKKMNKNIYKSISNSSQMFELASVLDNIKKLPD